MENFITEEEMRDIKLQCLHLAARYPQECIHTLMDNAEELFMFICGFERQYKEQEKQEEINPEEN